MIVGASLLAVRLAAPAPEPVVPPPAESETVVPAIEWRGDERCPDQTTVQDRVRTLLGVEGDGTDPDRKAVAEATRAEDGTWTVTLELSSEDGVRTRVVPGGRDCAEVAEAAAVVIAIAIDPDAASRAAQTQPITAEATSQSEIDAAGGQATDADSGTGTESGTETETDTETETETENDALPDPAPIPAPDPAARPRPPITGLVAVGGGLGVGNIPPIAGHVALDGGITLPRVRVTASVQYWFRSTEALADAAVDFRQWSIAARGCPVFGVRPILELMACGGVEVGQTLVATRGLAQGTGEPNATWLGWLVQPAVVVLPARWLGVRAGVEVFGPLFPVEYVVGDQPIWRHSPVGVRGIVALEARFGGPRPAGE